MDGCNSTCQLEVGWNCTTVAMATTVCKDICGNGIITKNEECDGFDDGCKNCK